jgi:phospholipid transport system transporter-binding protein
VLTLPPSLTQTTATVCLRELSGTLPTEPATVVVDAAGLKVFDSAALAVLLALRRETMKLGKTFAMTGVPGRLADLAQLYGISELLPVQAV